MSRQSTEAAFAAARAAEPDVMDRDELATHVEQLRAVRAWVDAAEVRAARRARELEVAGHSESAAAMAARVGKRSSKEARAVEEREAVCADMPAFESALGEGAVSAGHVDAVAAAARNLDEQGKEQLIGLADALVAQAGRVDVDAFARAMRDTVRDINAATATDDADELDAQRRRSTVKRWVDSVTGMHHTHLELDPLRDAKLWSAINAQLATERRRDGNRRTPWSQLQVDAVVNAAANGGGGGDDRRPEVTVLIDWATLMTDAHASTVCETEDGTALPVSTVRRLCCDADVLPVVLGGAGEALDAGRSRRTASRSQRRALSAMHRTCAHPECTVGFDACRIHHVLWWWEHHGDTDLDNLLPLCERHHHLVHEGGWTLTMTPTRVATWLRPDGSHHHTGTTIDRTPTARSTTAA